MHADRNRRRMIEEEKKEKMVMREGKNRVEQRVKWH
jgi:hypothetical protein